jgi:hypothetical protein
VIERAFNKPKSWRGLATHYDKHAAVCRGGMVLALIVLRLQARLHRHALVARLLVRSFVTERHVRERKFSGNPRLRRRAEGCSSGP